MLTPRPPARYSLYDLPIEIACDVGTLDAEIARVLGPFRVRDGGAFAGRAQATTAIIRPYEEADVMRRLSPRAKRVTSASAATELYEDGERFWLIDDRWGIVEINLLKSQWRAWLLPNPRVDPVRRAEMAVLWPMAQLLRARGLYLLPAVSLVRNGFGLLLLSPFDLGPELSTLVRAGCRVVGQRWTALREWGGHVEMLHLPGVIERPLSPRMRLAGAMTTTAPMKTTAPTDTWVDLAREHCGTELSHAPCTGVFVISPGRRPAAHLRPLGADAVSVLRGGWPIEELHPLRRHGQLPARLASRCACYEAALSRDPHELLGLMNALPQRGTGIGVTINRDALGKRRTAVAV
ncbi:MAG: hypothetical protein WBD40_23810 [Tepidisphaeraceae bacterium]